jgi:hypothetical protein
MQERLEGGDAEEEEDEQKGLRSLLKILTSSYVSKDYIICWCSNVHHLQCCVMCLFSSVTGFTDAVTSFLCLLNSATFVVMVSCASYLMKLKITNSYDNRQ